MDVAALNTYGFKLHEFLHEHHPRLAALCEVDHSHSWEPGALRLVLAENLSLSTHGDELTVFFGPMHVHLEDFVTAVELIESIENEDVLAVEWFEETKSLCSALHTRAEPLVAPVFLNGTPTLIRLTSYRGTFDAERVWRY